MRYQARVGDWEVTEVHDGRFKLDGGAMFGVVPRPLWEKLIPPDEQGRIPLALRCLLLRGHDRVALIDTGMGSKWTEKERVIYAVDHSETDLLKDLAACGVAPEDVTDVLITHLHFDHAGGNTRLDEGGAVVPTFPGATYHVPAANLAHALLPEERDHVSYRRENWEAIEAAPRSSRGSWRRSGPGTPPGWSPTG
jgi:glyoxylase-like metal-dependent hydrolase (beta-lactamase superfamily II)